MTLVLLTLLPLCAHAEVDGDPNAPTAEGNVGLLQATESGILLSSSSINDAGLWIVDNWGPVDKIYHVDPLTGTVISSFDLPGSVGYDGAGLEADPDGNLWAVNQGQQMVYQITPDGTVLNSWPTPFMNYTWGLGHDGSEVWLSDVNADLDTEVTTAGVPTGVRWPTPWVGSWPGDLAWDGTYLWQVNVGGDEHIYQLDPATGAVITNIGDPDGIWDETSQRALAYDPATDTFYVGGWNQDKMYRIQGLSWPNPGKIISSFDFPNPAGAAWITVEDQVNGVPEFEAPIFLVTSMALVAIIAYRNRFQLTQKI